MRLHKEDSKNESLQIVALISSPIFFLNDTLLTNERIEYYNCSTICYQSLQQSLIVNLNSII